MSVKGLSQGSADPKLSQGPVETDAGQIGLRSIWRLSDPYANQYQCPSGPGAAAAR